MTVQEVEKLNTDTLTPEQVASVLGCNQYSINLQARDDPSSFGFPVIRIGTRVRIPKAAFVRFMRGELPLTCAGCADCFDANLRKQIADGNRFCRSCGRRLPRIEGVSA